MVGVLQFSITRIAVPLSSGLLRSSAGKIGVRSIAGKALRYVDPEVKKPAPYPYETKKYSWLQRLYDRTVNRMDENSKVVVVEGPVAAGKSAFAKELASELDMQYFPEANLDMIYINKYGFDLKTLDPQLPESCRSYDVKEFCENPKNPLAANFQIQMFVLRYSQYIDALAHLLSTGQGVVLDRCVYSDFVFVEAMFKSGYMSKIARAAYYELKKNCIGELLKPHLVIYLDVPVAKVQANIKARSIPYEVNSKLFSHKYLSDMESAYKLDYLKLISNHAQLLVYDWSEPGEVEVVVEDIERVNFDNFGKHDAKMKDWRLENREAWDIARNLYADDKSSLMAYLNVPMFQVPELLIDGDDVLAFKKIWHNAPGMKYETGFNADAGDTGVLTRMGSRNRGTLPMRERR